MSGPWEDYQTVQAPSAKGPWEDYGGPALVNPNLQAQGRTRENLRYGADFLSSRDPGIDYRTGIPSASFRYNFSRMTNDAEKEQYLNKNVGKDLWGRDSFGAYFIKPEGLKTFGISSDKPVSIDEQFSTRYDVADIGGDAPAIAGGVLGGLLGLPTGPVGSMALAAQGAMGGRALSEIVKNLRGEQVGGGPEVAAELAKEGGLSLVGEGLVRAATPIAKFAIGPGVKRMTPEKLDLLRSAQEQGFKPRAGAVTDAPILSRWEGMINTIFGDLDKEINEAAAKAGIARLSPKKPVTMEEAGEALKASVRKERVTFGANMAEKYADIDKLVGNRPIIPMAAIKQQAQNILDVMPQTSKGKVVGGKDVLLHDIIKMEDSITVAQAQRLRTMFREAADDPTLVPDVSKHDARLLKDAVNKAFDDAKAITSDDPNVSKAITMLRGADASYAMGIRKFDNAVVTAISRNASKAGAVDADMVVDYLIKPDRVVRLRNIKNVVPAAEWEKVKAAHAKELVSNITQSTADPLKTLFNGHAFRDVLDKYGRQTLEEVHGKEWTDAAYKYANALMLSQKRGTTSGIVAAKIALHPWVNLPHLVWLRGMAKVLMENPLGLKYLTEGIKLGPSTKAGAAALSRFGAQVATLGSDETGSAKVVLTEPE